MRVSDRDAIIHRTHDESPIAQVTDTRVSSRFVYRYPRNYPRSFAFNRFGLTVSSTPSNETIRHGVQYKHLETSRIFLSNNNPC